MQARKRFYEQIVWFTFVRSLCTAKPLIHLSRGDFSDIVQWIHIRRTKRRLIEHTMTVIVFGKTPLGHIEKRKKNLVLICATYHQVRAWSPYPVPWCRRWHWSKYTMERNGTVGQHTHCSQLQTLSTQTMWTRSDPPSLSPTRSYKTTYSSPCHMATSKKLSIFKMLEPRAWCFYVFPVSRFPLWNKRSI